MSSSSSSDERKLLVIVGITGKQGSSVAKVFQELEPNYRIRGLTRDATKPTLAPLRDQGIELVTADTNSPDTLKAAFAGASAIFGMTDFFSFQQDPRVAKLMKEKGMIINEAFATLETEQGKNIVDAAAVELEKQDSKLEKFVFSTLSNSTKWSQGRISWNWHFDSKAKVTDYVREAHADGLAKITSFVQFGVYMDVWTDFKLFGPVKQSDGNFLFSNPRLLFSSEPRPLPWIHTSIDAGHFVRALITSPLAPPGTMLLATSTDLTKPEFSALWTKIMHERKLIPADKSLTYKDDMSLDQYIEALNMGPLGREVAEAMVYTSEFGIDGGDPDVKRPEAVGVEVERLTSFEDYIRTTDWSSVL